jgi:nucleotide-binding universal stress UspA family protein
VVFEGRSDVTRIRSVLFATDFSKASGRAFGAALALTRATGAKLTILSVIAPVMPIVPEVYLDAATTDRLEREAKEWSARQLRKLVASAKRAKIRAGVLLRRGDPVAEILRTIKSVRADVVVMGTHGRRGFSKLVLGSVAEQVIAAAPCPVMTVRAR